MKKAKNIYIVLLFTAIISSLLLTALRTAALIEEFDADAGYYTHNAVLPSYFTFGTLAIIAVLFVSTFLCRRSFSNVEPAKDSSLIVFTSALLSFMIIAVFIFGLFSLSTSPSTVTIMTLVLALPAALYPLIGIALPVKSKNGQIMLAVFMLLWLFSETLSIYFKSGIAINNPNRSLELAAVALFLFFFVFECRYTVGTQKPWLYVFFGLSSLVVSGMYTLPNVILVIMKLYPDTLDVTFEFICAAIWVYILLRMCLYADLVGKTVEDTVSHDVTESSDEETDSADNSESAPDDDKYTIEKDEF